MVGWWLLVLIKLALWGAALWAFGRAVPGIHLGYLAFSILLFLMATAKVTVTYK